MTRKEAMDTTAMLNRLGEAGISTGDALALRRISMTLRRWFELECGVNRGSIVRDERTGRAFWRVPMPGNRPPIVHLVADRETGARKRLAAIMARYPTLAAYVQGDPRGCALYILRPGDVPSGDDVSCHYSRGVAVYK